MCRCCSRLFAEALKTGNIDPKSATVVARLRLAIGVKKVRRSPTSRRQSGEAHAAECQIHHLRDPEQGSVGGAALLALDKMGITAQLRPKIKWVPTGGVVQDSVAKARARLLSALI